MAFKSYYPYLLATMVIGSCLVGSHANYDLMDEGDAPGEAFLIARKYILESPAVATENLTIVVDIFNAGSIAATSVKLRDDSIVLAGDTFDFVEGTSDASWEKIGAGSNVSHRYVVKASTAGVLEMGPASIIYRPDPDSTETKITLTTTPVPTPLLSVLQKYMEVGLVFGRYVSLGFCKTKNDWKVFGVLTLVLMTLFGGNSAAHKYKAWRRNRQYKSATEFLMKDE